MDQASTVTILNVSTPEYGKVLVETTDGVRYFSDLSSLSKVYCFPKDLEQWQEVSVDSDGLALVWSCRFEVHVDQILTLSIRKEKRSSARESHHAQM